jgi:L-ascorbate metabolism protein UlaG (beta-lactamase superfamily)
MRTHRDHFAVGSSSSSSAGSLAALIAASGLLLAACGSSQSAGTEPDSGPPEDTSTVTVIPPASGSAARGAAPGASSSAAPPGSASPEAYVDDPSIRKVTTTLETSAGPVVVHAVHHGTLYLVLGGPGGKVVWLDPWGKALAALPGGLANAPKADAVLVTDIHPDHLDPAALLQVKKADAVVIAPKAAAEKLPAGTKVLANGESTTFDTPRGPLGIEATPMYNLKRGPEAGKLFHEKGRGNGYLLTYGGKRIYISGDTECTPEMKALTKVDLAFVTMNVPYTMPPEEAAECIAAFEPKVVVPFHYRGSDLKVLDQKLAGSGVTVEKLRFY